MSRDRNRNRSKNRKAVRAGWSTTLTTYARYQICAMNWYLSRSYNNGAPLGPKYKFEQRYQCKWGPKWGPNGTQVNMFKLLAPVGPKYVNLSKIHSRNSELYFFSKSAIV